MGHENGALTNRSNAHSYTQVSEGSISDIERSPHKNERVELWLLELGMAINFYYTPIIQSIEFCYSSENDLRDASATVSLL